MTINIKELVNRFLAWPLPASLTNSMHMNIERPIGTHLMNADEATAMFEYVLATRRRAEGGNTSDKNISDHAAKAPAAPVLPETLPDDALRYAMECSGNNNPAGARLVRSIYHFIREALASPASTPEASQQDNVIVPSLGDLLMPKAKRDAVLARHDASQQAAAVAAPSAEQEDDLLGIGNRMATTLEVLACALKNPGTAEGVRRTVEEWRAAAPTAVAATTSESTLRNDVRQLVLALAAGKWPDMLTTDRDAMPLEQQIRKLICGPATTSEDARDAAKWRMLPAVAEDHQINLMQLYRDIEAAMRATQQEGE